MEIKYKNTAGMDEKEILGTAKNLREYSAEFKKINAVNLPFDEAMQRKIKELAQKKTGSDLKYIILVGIGGSELGARAVCEAVFGKLYGLERGYPKIIFENVFSQKLQNSVKNILASLSKKEEFLILVASKSGKTFETMKNFDDLRGFLKEKFGEINGRVVVITDKNSPLWQTGKETGFDLFEAPKDIAGRFSVFSAVGILPMVLAGIKTDNLLSGARDMRDKCFENEPEKNPALLSASLIYLARKKGLGILNSFFFDSELETLGKWRRQLIAESIGKSEEAGITPIVSTAEDLHSTLQLYLAGPKDKFTEFVYSPASKKIAGAVKESYTKRGLPFMEIILPEISENALGQYMQYKMTETIFLAKLFKVNPFDQPAVEEYKKDLNS